MKNGLLLSAAIVILIVIKSSAEEKSDIFYYNKGVDVYNLGKYEESLEYFDEAIKLNLKDGNSWYNKALTLGKLKNMKRR